MSIYCGCLTSLLHLFTQLRVSEEEGTGNISSSSEASLFRVPMDISSDEITEQQQLIQQPQISYDSITETSSSQDAVSSMPIPFLEYDDEKSWRLRWVVWGTYQAFQSVKIKCFDSCRDLHPLHMEEVSIYPLIDSLVVKQMTLTIQKAERIRRINWTVGDHSGILYIPKSGQKSPLTFAVCDQHVKIDTNITKIGDVIIPINLKIGMSYNEQQNVKYLYDCFVKSDSPNQIMARRGVFSLFFLQHMQTALKRIAESFPSTPCILRAISGEELLQEIFASRELQKRLCLQKALYRSFLEIKGLVETGMVQKERIENYCLSSSTSLSSSVDIKTCSVGKHTIIFLDEGSGCIARKDLISHTAQTSLLKEIQQGLIQEARTYLHSNLSENPARVLVIVGKEPLVAYAIELSETGFDDADSDMVMSMISGVSGIASKYKFQPLFITSGSFSSVGDVKIKDNRVPFISLSNASSPLNIGSKKYYIMDHTQTLSCHAKYKEESYITME